MNAGVLLERYHLEDIAIKVVGVGSVGTFCGVALFLAEAEDPLLLQIKEARPSVLEPYAGKSEFSHEGERVVVGQRLMQSASDMMLGWTTGTGKYKRQFYIRAASGYEIFCRYFDYKSTTVVPVCRNMWLDTCPCPCPDR